jgi:LacI family transcriptional regulator
MKNYKTPKLKDVAELAGVSIATANQVLNNYVSRFSSKTCEKVLNAAKELSYRPNIAARSLQSRKSYTVGILFFAGNSIYMNDFMHAVQYSLLKYQYAPIFLTHSNEEEEERNLEICMARHVDGIIANAIIDAEGRPLLLDRYIQLLNSKVPLVEIFGTYIPDTPHFSLEYYPYGYNLTERLYKKGCRNIGFLTHSLMEESGSGSKKYWDIRNMWDGYVDAVTKNGMRAVSFTQHLDSDTETEGVFYWNTYKIAGAVFSKESGLDGIVCFNEEQALALVNYGNSHGVDLHKFLIATVGRSSNKILSSFPVEQVERPIKEIGRNVVSALMKKIT